MDPVGIGAATPSVNYNQINHFVFVDGDTVASSPSVTGWQKFTASYMVNINNVQPPGFIQLR